MKNKFIPLLLLSLFGTGILQGQTNFRFADTTAQWNVLEMYLGVDSTFIYNVTSDTVVNGTPYQKIAPLHGQGDFSNPGLTLVRRDSLNRIFVRGNDSTDYLIYNFNAQVGDTFTIAGSLFPVKVYSVDTVMLITHRKKMTLCARDTMCELPRLVCIDGIGAINDNFLMPAGFGLDAAGGIGTLCYFQADSLLWHDTAYSSCLVDTVWTLGITDVPQLNAKVYPGLVTEQYVDVQLAHSPAQPAQLELYDITGKLLLQKKLPALLNHVQLNGISSGVYIYSIISQQQKIGAGKLVVQ